MVRGEVFLVRLEPRSGSEQAGIRPCVLVSHDSFNSVPGWRSLTVLPCTSSERWLGGGRTVVVLEVGEAGLPRPTAVLGHQVTTVDRSKIQEPALGRLSPARLAQVDAALRNYLDLRPGP